MAENKSREEGIIRAASGDGDAVAVGSLYRKLLIHEKIHGGHSSWELDVYPTYEDARTAALQDTLFVMDINSVICASMILNSIQPPEYLAHPWKFPAQEEQVMVLHTLCIDPAYAGQGIGSRMVKYACDYARSQGYHVVRLDTYIDNLPAFHLYEKMGFVKSGEIDCLFQGSIPQRQHLFEMNLIERV